MISTVITDDESSRDMVVERRESAHSCPFDQRLRHHGFGSALIAAVVIGLANGTIGSSLRSSRFH